jgi:ribonuclease G
MVQVVKEPLAKKGARLTTQISLPGRFLVLMPQEKRIGVSRKISSRAERHRLRELMAEIKPPQNLGIILRTAALRSDKKSLKRDLKQLLNAWRAIEKTNRKSAAPAVLHEELGLVMRNIRDSILTDVDSIMVDSKAEYKKITHFLNAVAPATSKKVVYYRERAPLFEKHHLEEEIARLFQARISLQCGGTIVLNQTEALVAVDVNTGKHKGKKDQARTALTANLEAAVEIAKQLRLRNVGGLVVIDFIDMESKRYQRQVMSALLKELKKDRAKTRVLPFSEFCLVEMTRQREHESFMRKVYQPCPFCQGQGAIKSLDSMELEVERKILRALSRNPRVRRYRIEAHPHLARYLLEEGWEDLRQMARANRIRLSIIDNSTLGFQEYIIWILSRNGDIKG